RYDELLGSRRGAVGRLQERTWHWLCALYFASPEFKRLEASTQSVRRRILEATCKEPVAPGERETFANFPIERLTSKAIRVLRDRKALTPHAANNRLKAIRYI